MTHLGLISFLSAKYACYWRVAHISTFRNVGISLIHNFAHAKSNLRMWVFSPTVNACMEAEKV